ncbi:hypothetical protein [Citrobacter amalonaticus]|jgi:uncharacterized membrane protein HdeD (DUF308 family)|uniref:hypothetical protein n=1 Tax=Citrobacter amalonaticus TaxID=35703 RepID=UPI00255ACFE7|nr:hypothetical protein [Citrobacter amalonaticus]MDL4619255.1 hypothetical protein [Citrobacter amalonaticus]MDL4623353.1 hypothetical protein [Citrobacter amalonaticus]
MDNKRKRRKTSIVETLLIVNFGLILISIGLFETVWAFDNKYYQPDYIVDDFNSFFAGSLFVGLAVMLISLAPYVRSDSVAERIATWLFLFVIALAPIWSAVVCIVQSQTIAHYKNPPFGVCYSQGSHGRTYMYVKNSDWCQHFGYHIARTSLTKGKQ